MMTDSSRPRRNAASLTLPQRMQSLFYGDPDVLVLPKKFEVLHRNPNIYLVRDFLTASEIAYFDKVCTVHAKAFKASFTQDDHNKEVVSEERTSTHIHLSKAQHASVRTVESRAADLVGLHSQHVEPLQIVSYRNGQKFNVHHDAGTLQDDGSVELAQPRRLVTFFAYLNNLPRGEGHTEFPAINLSVQPERGCAVVFCNVLPNGAPDPRTVHRANPVSGQLKKYGVNIWLCDCSMQELAQVKANCAVGAEAVVDETTSALTMAEYYTKKHNAEHRPGDSHASTGASGRWAEKQVGTVSRTGQHGHGRWAEKGGRAPSPSDYWFESDCGDEEGHKSSSEGTNTATPKSCDGHSGVEDSLDDDGSYESSSASDGGGYSSVHQLDDTSSCDPCSSGSKYSPTFVFRLPRTADALYFYDPSPQAARCTSNNVVEDSCVRAGVSANTSNTSQHSSPAGSKSGEKGTLRLSFGGEEVTLSGSKRGRREYEDTGCYSQQEAAAGEALLGLAQ
jgi:hypothetical protein